MQSSTPRSLQVERGCKRSIRQREVATATDGQVKKKKKNKRHRLIEWQVYAAATNDNSINDLLRYLRLGKEVWIKGIVDGGSSQSAHGQVTKECDEDGRLMVELMLKPETWSNGKLKNDDMNRDRSEAEVSRQPRKSVKHAATEIVSVRSNRLIPVFHPATMDRPRVLITSETSSYRTLAQSQVYETDRVLEIGCSTGEASVLLMQRVRHWLGIDTSEEMVSSCRSKVQQTLRQQVNPHKSAPKVIQIDIFMDPRKAVEQIEKFFRAGDGGNEGPSVIFIDIGGNRDLRPVLRMIHWTQQQTFSSSVRLWVIKSRELVKTALDRRISDRRGQEREGRDLEPTGLHNVLPSAQEWMEETLSEANAETRPDDDDDDDAIGIATRTFPSHPLKAPMAMTPVGEQSDNQNESSRPICRYHNYHRDGCRKGNQCEFDHEYCHACLEKGHIAKVCPATNWNYKGGATAIKAAS